MANLAMHIGRVNFSLWKASDTKVVHWIHPLHSADSAETELLWKFGNVLTVLAHLSWNFHQSFHGWSAFAWNSALAGVPWLEISPSKQLKFAWVLNCPCLKQCPSWSTLAGNFPLLECWEFSPWVLLTLLPACSLCFWLSHYTSFCLWRTFMSHWQVLHTSSCSGVCPTCHLMPCQGSLNFDRFWHCSTLKRTSH